MATIGERITAALGGVTQSQFKEAVRAAENAGYVNGFNDGNDDPISGTTASFGYRSTAKKLRDFSEASAQELMATAWKLWQSSPVAKRILTLKRDHIAGRNVSPAVTGDDEAAELIEGFWSDNELDKRSGEFTLQLFALGEQCYSLFVRESDGRVRIGYIDPANITEVICHPFNDMDLRMVVVGDARNGKGAVLRVVRKDEDVITRTENGEVMQKSKHDGLLVTAGQANIEQWEIAALAKNFNRHTYDGTCLLTRVNAFSNQSRGVSDLIQVADWIDQADETLFALGDREQYADFFSWDVEIDGGPEDVSKRSREIAANPPKKGSFNVHNSAEKWSMMTPDLRQQGSIGTYRALLGLILGGVGFPVHWFGYGDDANRATALAQGDPTIKSLEYDQSTVRDMFETLLQFAIDQAVIAGASFDEALTVGVQMPELSTKDLAAILPTFGQFAVSLLTAVDAGWMSQETAAQAWAKLMAEFGIEINVETELQAIAD